MIITGVMVGDPNPVNAYFLDYPIRAECWRVGDRDFQLIWPADMDALLDAPRTQDRFRRDEYMPYWAQPWPSSVHLAEKILRSPPGAGREAIELGAGVGLVSMAAALRGWRVTVTDYDADAVGFAAENARRNHLRLAGAHVLDYRTPLPAPRFDLVLGSDLLYERRLIDPIARWIASALRVGGEAWLGDPNRSAADGFPQRAAELGLAAAQETSETTAPRGMVTRARIWSVRWA